MTNYHQLVENVKAAFQSGRTRSVEWRIQQLESIKRMLEENEDQFLAALKSDLNKPVQEALMSEIDMLKNEIIGILRHIKEWTQTIKVEKSPITLFDGVFMQPEPYGTALIIGAWNFPLLLTMSPVLPALAAGNCVIMKPSEISPATAKLMEDLVPKYLDNKCVKVVCGGVAETTELLKERYDYIFYTGSTPVGKIIGEAANKYLTPCTLELGGKSPTYIDNSGNLEYAIRRLCWGKFMNCGQICVAPDYILCTKEVEKKILPMMEATVRDYYGDSISSSPDYCRIVSDRHQSRLEALLKQTKGKVAFGGKSDPNDKFLSPTVVSDVKLDDALMKEEIFGPILPIVTVNSAEEAVKIINEREKPLAMYIFSAREGVIDLFTKNTSSGGICVNDTIMHLGVEELPFGGVGYSGMGSYHGKHGFDTFTHYKPILKKDLGLLTEKIGEMRYPPYNVKTTNLLRNLSLNRSLPDLGWLKTGFVFGFGAMAGYLFNTL